MTGRAEYPTNFLAVVLENVELRKQLADVQDQCVELAVDAGDLHAEIVSLREQLHVAEQARDRWRGLAEHRITG
ncbi:hypothetical protein [Methylobacterium sp. J-090]|uniref:hypothetical protein n=1 Tax=Methylobacterium sp. J-090 TaxID=2836666 RepID=UPI001FBA36AF|nr:hypothetical protein [Methylobacterium sp. J-090]MCJ2084318.1 hypothetical protein [Methylobacterium sp. J-090]